MIFLDMLTDYICTQRLGEWPCFKIFFFDYCLNYNLIVFWSQLNMHCMVRKWSFAMMLYDSTSPFVFRSGFVFKPI